MVSPSLHSLLAQARVEELHRGARASLGSGVNRPNAMRLPAVVKRAINRVLPWHAPVAKEACHG
jgi:hypothetical protein